MRLGKLSDLDNTCDILVVGGGAAGMAAACALWETRPDLRIVLAEREEVLGGVLHQCIHSGFGPGGDTGPEYEKKLEQRLCQTEVQVLLNADVMEIKEKDRMHYAWIQIGSGKKCLYFSRAVLAAGCYERMAGSLMISGTRPQGIYGAGELQRMINLENYQPAKSAVIIGSGDIGLIMARRLTICGTKVKRIVEIQDHCPALKRNQRRCLEELHMQVQLNSSVAEVQGDDWITGVTIENQLNKKRERISCEMLVVAAGLIPDQTLLEGMESELKSSILLVGNCEYIHPMAETIVQEAEIKCRNMLYSDLKGDKNGKDNCGKHQ